MIELQNNNKLHFTKLRIPHNTQFRRRITITLRCLIQSCLYLRWVHVSGFIILDIYYFPVYWGSVITYQKYFTVVQWLLIIIIIIYHGTYPKQPHTVVFCLKHYFTTIVHLGWFVPVLLVISFLFVCFWKLWTELDDISV